MSLPEPHQLVSGTALALDGRGVLLVGPTGCGKSDLALRLIEAGWRLVSDDVVELRRVRDGLELVYPGAAPAELKGRIEARGLGIVKVPVAQGPIPLNLVVRLVGPEKVQRMPDLSHETYLGLAVRRVDLTPFEPSCPAKVRLALDHGEGGIIPAP